MCTRDPSASCAEKIGEAMQGVMDAVERLQKGAEGISSAAEEQASAVNQATSAVDMQASALAQCEQYGGDGSMPIEEAAADYERLYRLGVQGLDAVLGPWLEKRESAGHFRHTAMILTSDHGEAFGEHYGLALTEANVLGVLYSQVTPRRQTPSLQPVQQVEELVHRSRANCVPDRLQTRG